MTDALQFDIDAVLPAPGAWNLVRAEPAGERDLPLDEFLACFDPAGSLPGELKQGRDAGRLAAAVSALDWDLLTLEDWARLAALLAELRPGAWAAFAAAGARLAAERAMGGSHKARARRAVNPYGDGALDHGEELLAEIFAPEGKLASCLGAGYEARAEQREMALAVWQCLAGGSDLVVEAPTGVGKTLAYAIAAGLFALAAGERVVISTHTRHLQDQLILRDLPVVSGSDWLPVSVALLKGRDNYLCRRKLERWLRDPPPEREAILAAVALIVWSRRSGQGLVEELEGNPLLPPSLLQDLAARSDGIEEGRCAARRDCWVAQARERARTAQLVVINHSLLMADHAVGRGILGAYRYLVVDEAQHLDAVATRALGVELSGRVMDSLLQAAAPEGLWSPFSRRGLAQWLPAAQSLGGEAAAWRRDLLGRVPELRAAFRAMLAALSSGRAPDGAAAETERRRYGEAVGAPLDAEAAGAPALRRGIDDLEALARSLAPELDQAGKDLAAAEAAAGEAFTQEAQQLEAMAKGLQELRARMDFLLAAQGDDFVFYIEREGQAGTALVASPVDVSLELGDFFREGLMSAVLTSATLAVAGRFDYFAGKTGLDRSGRELHPVLLKSPFAYDEQVSILLPAYLPEPGQDGHLEATVDLLAHLAQVCPLNTLVLMTSYLALDRVSRGLRERGLPEARLLVQTPGQSRDALARRFRSGRGSLLLGTSSFWEGVDFPGASLEILVIVRLPFAVPAEPLVQARCERIAREGGDAFQDYMVPEAVLRFKQGFGRLIRSRRDQGLALMLDSRLSRKNYGRRFLSSLPAPARLFFDAESLREALHDWYTARPRLPDQGG